MNDYETIKKHSPKHHRLPPGGKPSVCTHHSYKERYPRARIVYKSLKTETREGCYHQCVMADSI